MPGQMKHWHPRALRDMEQADDLDFFQQHAALPQFPALVKCFGVTHALLINYEKKIMFSPFSLFGSLGGVNSYQIKTMEAPGDALDETRHRDGYVLSKLPIEYPEFVVERFISRPLRDTRT